MKVQGFSLVHSLPKKSGKKLSNSKCKVMKAEVLLEDMGVGKNGAKVHATQEDFLTCPRTKL
jgi:hypothetical protein